MDSKELYQKEILSQEAAEGKQLSLLGDSANRKFEEYLGLIFKDLSSKDSGLEMEGHISIYAYIKVRYFCFLIACGQYTKSRGLSGYIAREMFRMMLLIQIKDKEEEKQASKDFPKMPYFRQPTPVNEEGGKSRNHLLSKKIFISTLKIIFNGSEKQKRHLVFQLYYLFTTYTLHAQIGHPVGEADQESKLENHTQTYLGKQLTNELLFYILR